MQDIDGHLRGGIPERDLDALNSYWQVLPGLREVLFESASRVGYFSFRPPVAEVKPTVLNHAEFHIFTQSVMRGYESWKAAVTPRLIGFKRDERPNEALSMRSQRSCEPHFAWRHCSMPTMYTSI